MNYLITSNNKNYIYFDFPLFKKYNNFSQKDCCTEVFSEFDILSKINNEIELHVNIKDFTLTACCKYQEFISRSLIEMEKRKEKIKRIILYYTPKTINSIRKVLSTLTTVKYNIEYVDKNNSDTLICKLFRE
jgi:hypothetical protein